MIWICTGINDADNASASEVGGCARVTQANDVGGGLRGVVAGNRAAKEAD